MNRLRLPDLLKGIAILFMIQVHIMELFIDFAGQESVFGKISLFIGGPFTAMIFMMVMGYFVAGSKKTFKQNVGRGIKIFVLGFFLNIGLNFNLLLKIKFADWPYNPLEYIFGVDILNLAGLSILFLAVLKVIKKGQVFISFVLLLVVIFFTGKVNELLRMPERNYITPFVGGKYSWSYFPLFPWLAYPLAGYFFFFAEDKIKRIFSKYKISSLVGLMFITVAVIYFWKPGFLTTINLPAYYHHTFDYAIWAFASLGCWIGILFLYIQKFKTNTLEKFLAWMGKNITLIYVIQWLIIGNIATEIYQTQGIERYFFWLGGIFLITVLLTWLLGKTNIQLAQ